MAGPPIVGNSASKWRAGTGQDPAAYLVDPNTALYNALPSFRVGSEIFVFPVGPEGFSKSGAAQLAVHHFLGDDFPQVQITHKGDRRIELSGEFPGRTSVENMQHLENLLNSPTPAGGKRLYVPGVFSNEQIVAVENYSFDRAPEDQTHSIAYRVVFLITTVGRKVDDPHGTPAPPNPTPGQNSTPRGDPLFVFTVRDGAASLHSVADDLKSSPDAVYEVVQVNDDVWAGLEMPPYRVVISRLPVGTQLKA